MGMNSRYSKVLIITDDFEFDADGGFDFDMHALKARAYIQHERLLAEESDE